MSETKLSSTPDELEKLFMDPNRAKTEAEHWAVREIERLRDQNKLFRGALTFVAEYRALDFDPQKNLAAYHMSSVASEALEAKP